MSGGVDQLGRRGQGGSGLVFSGSCVTVIPLGVVCCVTVIPLGVVCCVTVIPLGSGSGALCQIGFMIR